MIIGLCGFKQSGKSTVGDILIKDFGFKRAYFAEPLKNMLATLYRSAGVTDENLIWEKLEGSLKEEYCEILSNTPRVAMQALGTEWRLLVDEKLWVNILINKLKTMTNENVVITDIRFPIEIAELKYWFPETEIWNIFRPGFGTTGHVSEQDVSILADKLLANDSTIDAIYNKIKRELDI